MVKCKEVDFSIARFKAAFSLTSKKESVSRLGGCDRSRSYAEVLEFKM